MINYAEKISSWLKAGAIWKDGVLLYKSIFGAQSAFLILIRKGGSQLKYEILKQALDNYAIFARHCEERSNPKASAYQQPKFRDEFPFIQDKDCPIELQILATKKITAYYNYTTGHEQLFDCASKEQQLSTVKLVVENFIENRIIYQELAHYQQHKVILGKHFIFKLWLRIQKFRKMKMLELVKERSNIEKAIWRVKSEIKKADKPHLIIERNASISQKEQELIEIDRIIENGA